MRGGLLGFMGGNDHVEIFRDEPCGADSAPRATTAPAASIMRVYLPWLRIGRGALEALPEALEAVNARRPFVVCDDNTYRAAGAARGGSALQSGRAFSDLHRPLPARPHRPPRNGKLGSMMMHFDTACDFILGVGSGVVNDLCKVFAHAAGRKSGIVGTAPSMDGFASNSSSMEVNNVKLTLYKRLSRAHTAGYGNTRAGAGAHALGGAGRYGGQVLLRVTNGALPTSSSAEYYCEEVADMMRASLKKIMAARAQADATRPRRRRAHRRGAGDGGAGHGLRAGIAPGLGAGALLLPRMGDAGVGARPALRPCTAYRWAWARC